LALSNAYSCDQIADRDREVRCGETPQPALETSALPERNYIGEGDATGKAKVADGEEDGAVADGDDEGEGVGVTVALGVALGVGVGGGGIMFSQ